LSRLKRTKIDFQTPLGELTLYSAHPDHLAAFKASYFQREKKGREGRKGPYF